MKTLTVYEGKVGERLDSFAAEGFGVTRSNIQKLIEEGFVWLNNKPAVKNARLKIGDIIEMDPPVPVISQILPEKIPLDILFEDDQVIVVNKPKGMVVHPAAGHYSGTLVNALLFHCGRGLSGINGVMRPGIVHRIDKDTSGVLVAAKTDIAHQALAEQLSRHTMDRIYHAIALGNFSADDLTIDKPIGRHPVDRKKMDVTLKNSKPAVTHIHVIQNFRNRGSCAYIQAKLETGRTHQIRVHMASVGHPLMGDEVYGKKGKQCELCVGQVLHAKLLGFIHPITGDKMIFETALPEYFEQILKELS
jgi:23S rRNA pseudouridine1911/1915/1917 synthase